MHAVGTTLVLHTEHRQMMSLTEKVVLWMVCGVLGFWRRERDGKVSYSCCDSLLFPHSLRQRRRWHSGGMLTDTDCGLKPQWYIFLTLLLTHRCLEGLNQAPSCRMQTFLNPREKVRGLQHCRSMMRLARTYTIAISQYHHNTFFS